MLLNRKKYELVNAHLRARVRRLKFDGLTFEQQIALIRATLDMYPSYQSSADFGDWAQRNYRNLLAAVREGKLIPESTR